MKDFGLYLIITEPMLSYEEIAEICVEEEIKMLQLREKDKSDRELLQIATRIRNITFGTETNLIIDDRFDIALLSGADGYHLGQEDIPYQLVKKVEADYYKRQADDKRKMISGLSTHNLTQLKEALNKKPDYVGFGPVYKTPTKQNPDPVVGLQLLRQAVAITDVPVVAIGGIDETNIIEVLKAGAKNIAMVRYLMQTKELRTRIRKIKKIMNLEV